MQLEVCRTRSLLHASSSDYKHSSALRLKILSSSLTVRAFFQPGGRFTHGASLALLHRAAPPACRGAVVRSSRRSAAVTLRSAVGAPAREPRRRRAAPLLAAAPLSAVRPCPPLHREFLPSSPGKIIFSSSEAGLLSSLVFVHTVPPVVLLSLRVSSAAPCLLIFETFANCS